MEDTVEKITPKEVLSQYESEEAQNGTLVQDDEGTEKVEEVEGE